MDAHDLIDRLEANIGRLYPLLAGVASEQARWKPAPDRWSILEVASHLLDEEREDFRTRLDFVLHKPGVSAPPIDPVGWVIQRKYNERDLAETVAALRAERQRSLAWLRGLAAPAWESALKHPAIGTIRAGDFLAAWVAHDFLHMRQLVHLHWLYLGKLADPYRLDYAGSW